MSRSYKKHPFLTDNGEGRAFAKREANKEFRRKIASDEEMPARPKYKKYSCSYDICDYKWRMTREEAIEWYTHYAEHEASAYFKKKYPTLESWLKYWEKCHKRK